MLRQEPPAGWSSLAATAPAVEAPRSEARFPWRVAVVAAVVLGAHGVGLVLGAYSRIARLDDAMHALGGFLTAWGLTTAYPYAVARGWIGATDRWTRSVLVLGMLAVVVLGWEFFEFACDRLAGTGFQGSVLDTMSDLLLGFATGTAYLLLRLRRGRTRRKPR